MIARTWHGLTPLETKTAFRKYLEQTGVRDALALPGKCAPDTAGALIAQTVLTILQERGDLHDEPA